MNTNTVTGQSFAQKLKSYRKQPLSLFLLCAVIFSAAVTVGSLLFIIAYILIKGIPNLSTDLFAWEYTSENVSMLPSIINTLIMTALSLLIAVPLGIFSAIYLTEYSKKGSGFVKLIRITAETLSGIPSIVYGLFGFLCFVIYLNFGYSLIAGALTLSIMILPLVMRSTEEALLAVPDSFREGSYGLGAGKLRTIFRIVLPSAIPGILAGVILATGRIMGESAALIYTAGTFAQVPENITSSARTLSVHLYALLSEGLYTEQAYATSVVLLVIVVGINTLSSHIAKKFANTASAGGK